ncbi:MAG: hypothetical protein JWN38_960 [Candidatus Saccharibacteria bacterium]|nr:hypothetical protein [Candidatus Saccharibacteria bacterium]
MKYPQYAQELSQLLDADQKEKKDFARRFFTAKDNAQLEADRQRLIANTKNRTARMLQILDEIKEPSLSNVGDEGALAISVLASHDEPAALDIVLASFQVVYDRDKNDCRYQSIPPMVDASRLAKRQPQCFGTQWFFDKNKYPFLPIVEDFEHVNERRGEYGIEPLRWPKSLAIPESEQPWLAKPLKELVMREPTAEEYTANLGY